MARLRFLLGLFRTQSGPVAIILAVQACLIAATLISDAVLSSRVSPAIIIASAIVVGSSSVVPVLSVGFVIGLALALKLERYLPDLFAVYALGIPLVGFVVVLERAFWLRSLPLRWVGHMKIILISALLSFLCWFLLSIAVEGILFLLGVAGPTDKLGSP